MEPWLEAFQALHPDDQEALQEWLRSQTVIIDNLGLSPDRWFEYVAWAIDNPEDKGYLVELVDTLCARTDVNLLSEDESPPDEQLEAIGSRRKTRMARRLDAEGLKEAAEKNGLSKDLYNRFFQTTLERRPSSLASTRTMKRLRKHSTGGPQ